MVSAFNPEAAGAFTDDLREYSRELTENFATHVRADPEDQLKPAVSRLLSAAGKRIGLATTSRTETRVHGVAGRPDLGAAVNKLLVGSIELKAPGKGADAHKFRGRDREQFQRFSALPNLVYTDGKAWVLYRNGQPVARVTLPYDPTQDGGTAVNRESAVHLLDLLAAFLGWKPVVPSRLPALAEMLAPLTRLLRNEVLVDVRAGGILADLANEWRQVFYPDADDSTFTDAYAQTLTYALLLARLEGAPSPLTAENAAKELDADHSLLAQALRVLAQPAATDAIGMPVALLERVIDAVDSERLTQGYRDPWLYF
jgi:hypothetical protein